MSHVEESALETGEEDDPCCFFAIDADPKPRESVGGSTVDMKLMAQVRRLVEDLTAGMYEELAADGRAGRMTGVELRTAVEEYGRTLIPLPTDSEVNVDVYEQSSYPAVVALDVALWTQEEGRSDLTLSLTATKQGETYTIEVDNLHVL